MTDSTVVDVLVDLVESYERMRAALEFYADDGNWDRGEQRGTNHRSLANWDRGERAREALARAWEGDGE